MLIQIQEKTAGHLKFPQDHLYKPEAYWKYGLWTDPESQKGLNEKHYVW